MNSPKSMIDEINEEIKQDALMKKYKENENIILFALVSVAIGIAIFQWWKKDVEEKRISTTINILDVIVMPSNVNRTPVLVAMSKTAPSSLEPYIQLLKNGRQLSQEVKQEDLDSLLLIYKDQSVDIIWRDLALLMYVSYNTKTAKENIELLTQIAKIGRPFYACAIEYISIEYMNEKDYENAIIYARQIMNDKYISLSMKNRIAITLATLEKLYIQAGGELKNIKQEIVEEKTTQQQNTTTNTAATPTQKADNNIDKTITPDAINSDPEQTPPDTQQEQVDNLGQNKNNNNVNAEQPKANV